MSAMQSEVHGAFRAIDIPGDEPLKAAPALGKRRDGVSPIEAERDVVRRMMGFALAFRAATSAAPCMP